MEKANALLLKSPPKTSNQLQNRKRIASRKVFPLWSEHMCFIDNTLQEDRRVPADKGLSTASLELSRLTGQSGRGSRVFKKLDWQIRSPEL